MGVMSPAYLANWLWAQATSLSKHQSTLLCQDQVLKAPVPLWPSLFNPYHCGLTGTQGGKSYNVTA